MFREEHKDASNSNEQFSWATYKCSKKISFVADERVRVFAPPGDEDPWIVYFLCLSQRATTVFEYSEEQVKDVTTIVRDLLAERSSTRTIAVGDSPSISTLEQIKR